MRVRANARVRVCVCACESVCKRSSAVVSVSLTLVECGLNSIRTDRLVTSVTFRE